MDNSPLASSGGRSGVDNYIAPWEVFLYSNGIIALESLGASGVQIASSGFINPQDSPQVSTPASNGQSQTSLISGSSPLGVTQLASLPLTSPTIAGRDTLVNSGNYDRSRSGNYDR